MYAWIWGVLPGRTWLKAVQAAVLLAVVLALLFLVVFPWVELHLPLDVSSLE
ncbi:hypothetical protein [Pseudonocardia endophytica]|uniref:Uncharacterized protein n=1 Tax=Pseudonocardia endophytica TaxID=401976 RepID=A0A4R1HK68_PSEEN|nr:hypothetical protein [Pseudonocardia endophytica]TCK20905.1 hypothetical protein EV378_4871 [Pseudonocardia endophytica]